MAQAAVRPPAAKKAAQTDRKLPEAAPGAPLSGHTVLFGGSFNPPHISHLLTALYLLEGLGASRVVVCPTSSHADKKQLPDVGLRMAWLKACFDGFDARVFISDIEARLGGTSFTYTTLRALRQELDAEAWAFCIGSDLAHDVMRWHRASELVASATPVVLRRSGYAIDEHAVRDALGEKAVLSPLALPEVASSLVRERYGRGASLAGLVPLRVAQLLAASPPPW